MLLSFAEKLYCVTKKELRNAVLQINLVSKLCIFINRRMHAFYTLHFILLCRS